MRTITLAALALTSCVLLIPIAGCAAQTPQTNAPHRTTESKRTEAAQLRAEIEALNRAMEQAWSRGDLLAVSQFYADDGRLEGPKGQVIAGRGAIDKFWTSLTAPKSWKLEVLDVGGSRDDAYQRGRSTLVQRGNNGDRVSVSEFVVIWKRDDQGRLRIALDFYQI